MPNPRPRANTERVAAMLGDVNLFLNDPDSRHHGELEVLHSLKAPAASCQTGMYPHDALLQVMIASPSRRRRGSAKEAVSLFIAWLCQSLVRYLLLRELLLASSGISPLQSCSSANLVNAGVPFCRHRSRGALTSPCLQAVQRLTVKIGTSNIGSQALFRQLGFAETSRSAVFNEVTMVCQGPFLQELARAQLHIHPYKPEDQEGLAQTP